MKEVHAAVPIYSMPLDVTNNRNATVCSQDRQVDHIRIHVQGSARTGQQAANSGHWLCVLLYRNTTILSGTVD